jgi:hypothetical protein
MQRGAPHQRCKLHTGGGEMTYGTRPSGCYNGILKGTMAAGFSPEQNSARWNLGGERSGNDVEGVKNGVLLLHGQEEDMMK